MEEFELKALETVEHPEKCLGQIKYYVDDTGVIIEKIQFQALFEHISQHHESIAFTIKEEGTYGALPMLGVGMIREGKNNMTDGYGKGTHMDHYLQWSSHHSGFQKLSVPSSPFHRWVVRAWRVIPVMRSMTGRPLSMRIKEHKSSVLNAKMMDVIGEYILKKAGHTIDFGR